MSRKLIIDHFVKNPHFSNGVTNYIKEVNKKNEEKYEVLCKPYNMNIVEFRTFIFNKLKNRNMEFDIIECAESQSPCLYLPNSFNIHVRMHCPFYLFKKIIKEEPSESRFSDEVRAMYKAKAVSSPSHGMLDLLNEELDISRIHVYKNPISKNLNYFKESNKKSIDILFFGRFNKLKGNEYLEDLISLLPKNYRIVIAGKQEHKINFNSEYQNLEILDHIEGDRKLELLSDARVVVSLSKFENCSMAILEALSVGTPVVAWNVGGNPEMAPPSLIRVAQLGHIEEIVELIIDKVQSNIEYQEFDKVINLINEDFKKGSEHVEQYIKGRVDCIYKGLDFRGEHEELNSKPKVYHKRNEETYIPINILYVTSNLASARFYSKLYENKECGVNMVIAYQGPYYSQIKDLCDYNLEQKIDSIAPLENIIKDFKFRAIVLDDSFGFFINDLYRISNKYDLRVAYSSMSIVNRNSYMLDFDGFSDLSSIKSSKIKNTKELIEIGYGNILIRGRKNYTSHELESVIEVLLKASGHYKDSLIVDIINEGSELLYDLSSSEDNYIFNLKNESSIDISDYSLVISMNDNELVRFLPYKNAIFIVNEDSVFYNKNIDNNIFLENGICVDVSSRDMLDQFILSRDLTFNPNLIRNI